MEKSRDNIRYTSHRTKTNKTQKHRKLKRISNTDPTKNWSLNIRCVCTVCYLFNHQYNIQFKKNNYRILKSIWYWILTCTQSNNIGYLDVHKVINYSTELIELCNDYNSLELYSSCCWWFQMCFNWLMDFKIL
jgi:hypothetical protein